MVTPPPSPERAILVSLVFLLSTLGDKVWSQTHSLQDRRLESGDRRQEFSADALSRPECPSHTHSRPDSTLGSPGRLESRWQDQTENHSSSDSLLRVAVSVFRFFSFSQFERLTTSPFFTECLGNQFDGA
jgi:hypothetical protein